jgi:hypothetical protein
MVSDITFQGLLHDGRYALFTGPEKHKIDFLQETLCAGIRSSRAWNNESGALTDTIRIFVPTNPEQDDGCVVVPISLDNAWLMVKGLGILSN